MITRRDLLTGLLAGFLLRQLGHQPAHAQETLRLGVLPVMSARASLEAFQPLLDYLSRVRRQRPELLTTPNFHGLYQRIREGQFDVALVPPHVARLAQADLGWQPLARCTPDHRSLLLVPEQGGPTGPEGLRGGVIAVLDRSALVVLIALEALRQRGLQEGRDFALLETRSYESSRLAVVQGRAQAFVSRSQGFFNEAQRDRFRILLDAGSLPGYVFAASPRLSPIARYHLAQHLLSFAATPEAAPMLARLGYQSMVATTGEGLRQLDPYLDSTRAALSAAG